MYSQFAQHMAFTPPGGAAGSGDGDDDGGDGAFADCGLDAAPEEYCALLQYHWREDKSNFLRMFIYQCARYAWSIVVQQAPTAAEEAAAAVQAEVTVADQEEEWYAALRVRDGIVNNDETYNRQCRLQTASAYQLFVHRVTERHASFPARKLTYNEYVVVKHQAKFIEQLALFMKFATATLRRRSIRDRAYRPMNDVYAPIAYTSIIEMQGVFASLTVHHLGKLSTTVITRELLAEHSDAIVATCLRSRQSRGALQTPTRRQSAAPASPAAQALRALNAEMNALFRVRYVRCKPLTTNAYEAKSDLWTLAGEHDTT